MTVPKALKHRLLASSEGELARENKIHSIQNYSAYNILLSPLIDHYIFFIVKKNDLNPDV